MTVDIGDNYLAGLFERADKLEDALNERDPHESYPIIMSEAFGLIGYIRALQPPATGASALQSAAK